MIPHRVQLQRTKGWRMPANTVKVERTTRWGNPFRVGETFTAFEAVEEYKSMLLCDTPLRADIKRELRGKNLACWCKPGTPCHADFMLQIANED